MKRIFLISCSRKKLAQAVKARSLYDSPLFHKSLAYAESENPDMIFVLSAKHGLLALDTEIEPYDLTLNNMRVTEIEAWATAVLAQLRGKANLEHDQFIFLAGDRYRRFLAPFLTHKSVPMQGLAIGRQLQFLGNRK